MCELKLTSLQGMSGSPRVQFKDSLSQPRLTHLHSSCPWIYSPGLFPAQWVPAASCFSEPTWQKTKPAKKWGERKLCAHRGIIES